MARETKTFRIGENEYHTTHLKAAEQRRVMRRLVALCAPLAGGKLTKVEFISTLVQSLSDEDLDVMTECFASETKVVTPQSGKVAMPLDSVLDDLFTGKGLSDWMQWLKECIQHNYAGFFVELRGQLNDLARVAGTEKEPESQNTSTG